MNDTSAKLFRTQIGGFNKEDVNQYILEADRRFAEETAALKQESEELRTQAAQLAADKENLAAALEKKENANLSLSNALSEKENQLAAAQSEAEAIKKELLAAQEELRSARAARDAIRVQLDALTAEKCSLTAALEAEKENSRKIEETLRSERSEKEESAKALAALEARKEQEKAVLAEKKEEEKAELKKRIEELLKQQQEEAAARAANNDPDEPGSDAYKLRMYDRISSQLGDILIGANRNADEILSAAKADAEKLRADTDEECEQKRLACDSSINRIKTETEEEACYIRERLSVTANELLSAVSTDLHGSVENCVREINTSITEMQYELRALMSKISTRTEEMNDRINYYQSCVSEGIEDKLTSMDEKYGIRHPESGNTEND